ncbi:MAG: chromosome partitioning protein, ParB family [Elusimicrobia bacterium]|nr:MAG: chromosome partitioning protein, ParB family [Elusimicrobiota bacterium]
MRKALGRGIEALLPAAPAKRPAPAPLPPGAAPQGEAGREIRRIPIDAVKPNRVQPRKNFDPERLSELSQTIKEHGLAQPIVVSYDAISNSYELIAGERRLRASQLAGLKTIEAVVRTPQSEKERLVLALIENIQRDDLNAIETALAYRKLMDEHGLNQTQIVPIVGKSKAAVSNTLRLLELPDEMQKAVQFERISEGHARALLMVDDPLERDKLYKLIVENHLSVRDAERSAQRIVGGEKLPEAEAKGRAAKPPKPADIKALEGQLEKGFGTRVEIRTRKDMKSGRIVIHFYSLDDFDSILKIINK